MIPGIRNRSYHQRIQDLDLISLVQEDCLVKLLIKVFKSMNRFTTSSSRRFFDYDINITEQETMEQNFL